MKSRARSKPVVLDDERSVAIASVPLVRFADGRLSEGTDNIQTL